MFKRILAGTVIFALLGGLGGVVVAQTDEVTDEDCGWYSVKDSALVDCTDPMAPSSFIVEVDEFGTAEVDGLIKAGSVITASDPRASGRLTTWKALGTGAWGRTSGGEFPSMLTVTPYPIELVNEAGSWTGYGTAVSTRGFEDDSTPCAHDWAELTGSGAYEGLTMYLLMAACPGAPGIDVVRRGVIVPTAQIGPIPELAAEAQSPSPDPAPWFGGRVEMPEHGFAVTVPDGWVGIVPQGDLDRQWQVIDEAWGAAAIRERDVSVSTADLYLVAGPGATPVFQECHVSLIPAGMAMEFVEVVGDGGLGDFPIDPDTVSFRTIDLPTGSTIVVDYVVEETAHSAVYFFERGDRAIQLSCSGGFLRPEDDWLSLAETLEFLPPAE